MKHSCNNKQYPAPKIFSAFKRMKRVSKSYYSQTWQ